jgi:mono/diheme cytochrome c family protein
MHGPINRLSREWPLKPFLLLLLLLAACMPVHHALAQEPGLKADPSDSKQVQRGQLVYRRFCALCHGANLEGQPDWRTRKPDGKLPAPPHDETGHTWHHPDELLFGITKHGLVPPYAPTDYKSDMPAWGGTLKDEDIWAVLAYIKSRWPAEIRERQAQINREALRTTSPAQPTR